MGKVIIYGPPGVGKSEVGKSLSSKYDVIESDNYRGPAPAYQLDDAGLQEALKGKDTYILLHSCPPLDIGADKKILLDASNNQLIERLKRRQGNEYGKNEGQRWSALMCATQLRQQTVHATINNTSLTVEQTVDAVVKELGNKKDSGNGKLPDDSNSADVGKASV